MTDGRAVHCPDRLPLCAAGSRISYGWGKTMRKQKRHIIRKQQRRAVRLAELEAKILGMTDEQLWRLWLRGSRRAFDELDRRAYDQVHAYVRHRLGFAAGGDEVGFSLRVSDLAFDVYLQVRAALRKKKYDPSRGAALRTYVQMMARCRCDSVWRSVRARREREELPFEDAMEQFDTAPDPFMLAETEEFARRTCALLAVCEAETRHLATPGTLMLNRTQLLVALFFRNATVRDLARRLRVNQTTLHRLARRLVGWFTARLRPHLPATGLTPEETNRYAGAVLARLAA